MEVASPAESDLGELRSFECVCGIADETFAVEYKMTLLCLFA